MLNKLRFIITFFKFFVSFLLTWFLLSLANTRLLSLQTPSFFPQEILNQQVYFKIGSQTTRITRTTDKTGINAVMSWIKETNLFFTNEHIVREICNNDNICEFQEQDLLSSRPSKRILHLKNCIPSHDICLLHPVNENLIQYKHRFKTIKAGDTIYYIDIRDENYKLLTGKITKIVGKNNFCRRFCKTWFQRLSNI